MAWSEQQFIEALKERNIDLVYSNFRGISKPLEVVCPKHGKVTLNSAKNAITKHTCPLCSRENKHRKMAMSQDTFIEKARQVWKDRFDYSDTVYVNQGTKIRFKNKNGGHFCDKNGLEHEQYPSAHLAGKEPLSPYNKEDFIQAAKNIYGDKYDYSLVEYQTMRHEVTIVCPIHGVFYVKPVNFLNSKHGCPHCATNTWTKLQTIEEANKIHEHKYDYLDVPELVTYRDKFEAVCPKHGRFTTSRECHIYFGHGCPECGANVSTQEKEICQFLDSLECRYNTSDRKLISPQELDIVVPAHKLAIEFNSTYHHSSMLKDKNYHVSKTEACENIEISLIHIFQHEWMAKRKIVENLIKSRLGLYDRKIFARNTKTKEIDFIEAQKFLREHHLQNSTNAKVNLGLFYGNELVQVLTLGKSRFSSEEWEIHRLCTKTGTKVIGGTSKLFKRFIEKHNPQSVVSYSDRNKFSGNIYSQLGFEFVKNTPPNYVYVKGTKILSRYQAQKQKLPLLLEQFDPSETETENMKRHGWYQIYDCGNKKFVYHK